ncbi:hypothetical protein COT97_04775 [Candidatus Falkowbacteria bacterium CG10_big_fil_rev_8_21_14_0_10_39_11]|uniref:Uncharacterized protein n=1 Tax=Candidatus Falkowbacteria bacterium CG10_big_fil_rev_8_21_14_0_10_39_11 TaxID=1974565 RepID=A0A2H0V3X0_9BACT|nr:MAG: hypothetical protein COT97_04775 [Candidatus Falkowbacteria bacterium CG10_big_fil_rev_8_21_14_0_10_39_11]
MSKRFSTLEVLHQVRNIYKSFAEMFESDDPEHSNSVVGQVRNMVDLVQNVESYLDEDEHLLGLIRVVESWTLEDRQSVVQDLQTILTDSDFSQLRVFVDELEALIDDVEALIDMAEKAVDADLVADIEAALVQDQVTAGDDSNRRVNLAVLLGNRSENTVQVPAVVPHDEDVQESGTIQIPVLTLAIGQSNEELTEEAIAADGENQESDTVETPVVVSMDDDSFEDVSDMQPDDGAETGEDRSATIADGELDRDVPSNGVDPSIVLSVLVGGEGDVIDLVEEDLEEPLPAVEENLNDPIDVIPEDVVLNGVAGQTSYAAAQVAQIARVANAELDEMRQIVAERLGTADQDLLRMQELIEQASGLLNDVRAHEVNAEQRKDQIIDLRNELAVFLEQSKLELVGVQEESDKLKKILEQAEALKQDLDGKAEELRLDLARKADAVDAALVRARESADRAKAEEVRAMNAANATDIPRGLLWTSGAVGVIITVVLILAVL